MTTPLTLREILVQSSLLSLLEELINGLNLSLWIEDEQGEVILGNEVGSSALSYPIFAQEQTMGQVRGSELGQVMARLLSYLVSQEMLVLFDDLTKIPNRRYGDRFLEREWKRAIREQIPLSLLMVDIDCFKLYNDYYGHQKGDECLQKIAQILSTTLRRPTDFVARYGGEEFLIVLPNTNVEGAEVVAQSIHRKLIEQPIPHHLSPVSPYQTVSMGIAVTIPQLNQSSHSLLLRADQALYRAKALGRNRYCLNLENQSSLSD